MRKLAAIDIGTNSMRLLLCCEQNGQLVNKEKALLVTRMGEGLSKNGKLIETAIDRNVEALCQFAKQIEAFGAEATAAIATSAVRDAENRDVFIKRAKDSSGIDIHVISGMEEAAMGIAGVMSEASDAEERVLIIDIGGGSTELILGTKKAIDYSISVNAGTVRMTEQFVSAHPVPSADIKNMEIRLTELFSTAIDRLKTERIDKVIGIGGTATTVAAIFHEMKVYDSRKVHLTELKADTVAQLFNRLRQMALSERYEVPGLQRERADVIPAGLCILNCLLQALSIPSMVISENDNLEGAIITYLL